MAEIATLTLTDFLLGRIEEDVVKRVTMREWHALDCETIPDAAGYTYPCECGVPERMLRECEAKRLVVRMFGFEVQQGRGPGLPRHYAEQTLRLLGEVYADHPDYRDEWRP